MSLSQPSARSAMRSDIVAFDPASTTRPASAGMRSPGRTKTSSTSGSAASASKSSKLAMRGVTGTATFSAPRLALGQSLERHRDLPAGARRVSARAPHQKQGQPVKRWMAAMPSSNRLTSPRNLLMM